MPSIRKAISALIILLLSVSLIGLILIYSWLPGYIEDKARQFLLQNTPFTRIDANIRHVGLYGKKIDHIEAGDVSHLTLSINSIYISYSPTGLLKKRIKRIDVAGLTFFLELNDGVFNIPGLDNAVLEKKESQPPAEINIPVDIQELQVNEGMLHLTVDKEQMLIPFNLTLKKEDSGRPSFYKSLLQLYPGSEQVTFAADIDLNDNQGLVNLSSKILPLEKFAPFLKTLPDLKVAGKATINGSSDIKLQPTEVISAGIEIGLQPFSLTINDMKVETPKENADRKPIKLTIDYTKKRLQYLTEEIPMAAPIKAIFDTKGELAISEEQLSGVGDFKVTVKEIPSVTIQEHVQLYGDVTYRYNRSTGNWHFNLAKSASSPAEIIKAQFQDVFIETGAPDYNIFGKGVADSGNISFSAANQQITIIQDGVKGSGNIALDGTLQFDANGLQGQVQAELQNGRLDFTENKYVIEDITLSVHLPALPHIGTDAGQVLRFSKASFGDFSITDGRVIWQLESSSALYLENSVFQWAGGNLRVNDVRLTLDKEQQFITILCDRLDLIEILQQFGIKNAEGEGTVSGKIPLLLGKNTLDFKNGLLSSSQGEGGRLKIVAFDLLAAGVPKNTPQFSQIDFAAEALKNFKYNWVKLFLNTSGDELVMQLQMDGNPMHPLPFSYNENGTFTRIEAGGQGIIRPIRLDVNLRFPLNRVLGYTGHIQDLLDRLKQ
jgi:hypothetical protein